MLGALLSFSAMAVAGREISSELDTFQLMFFRSLIGLAIILMIAMATGGLGQFRTRRLRLHIGRNLFHFVGHSLRKSKEFVRENGLNFPEPLWNFQNDHRL